MSKATKKKHKPLNRAQYVPGGGVTIPNHIIQSALIQAIRKNSSGGVNAEPLFSPGRPLDPQPGVDPGGVPRQWSFPVAYNSFPVDRSLGKPDIPSFQQLRMLARSYSGIGLCERGWLDMVPRMQIKISLTPEAIAGGAEEKQYQKEMAFFRNFFKKPFGQKDPRTYHTWLRMALKEQTQIDELYAYKQRDRAGRLIGLPIVAGDTMKPLQDDWGRLPLPPGKAFQQYPWGIPGNWYSTDEMLHYNESPSADTPHGFSRVERVILEVNIALRKKRRDLAMFTEGNIPQGLMEVPEASNWTPDQIDSYEQMWNSLIAGNEQQQVRVKFTQPGMKYIKTDSGEILTELDIFLLNIITGCYGMSMGDISFTGDIHKSNGDSQQNVLYRRTIDPLAMIYAGMFTDIMHNDFEPSLHGNLFLMTFGGYEEEEDVNQLAGAYSTLTGAGILGITNAGKLMNLPEDPNAPYIGRVIITKTGPIFLDDMATDMMRKAATDATLAGFQMAANGGQQQSQQQEEPEEDEEDSEDTGNAPPQSQQAKKGGKASAASTRRSTQERAVTQQVAAAADDYRRWRSRAIDDVKAGRSFRGFTTTTIPEYMHAWITEELERCTSVVEVRALFNRAKEITSDFGDWQHGDPDVARELVRLKGQGVKKIKWNAYPGCEHCEPNNGETRMVGEVFPNGCYLPPAHPGCGCDYEVIEEEKVGAA